MKKFLSLISLTLTLIFALSFSGCDVISGLIDKLPIGGEGDGGNNTTYVETLDGKTPEEIYTSIQQASTSATIIEMKTLQDINITVDGQLMVMKQTVLARIDGDNQYGKTSSVLIGSGTEVPVSSIEYWFVDGTYYYRDGTQKLYFNINLQEFTESLGMGGEDAIGDIPKDWFKDVKFELIEDIDTYKLSFNISGDEYEQVFGKLGLNGTNISDVKYEMFFTENGEMIDNVASFAIDMVVSGMSCRATVTQKSEIFFTLSEEITLPSHLSEFVFYSFNPFA